MKSTLISSCFLSAALAAPFTARAVSTTIQMKTGDSDVSVQVTIPLDAVFSTAENVQAQIGASAFVLDTGVTCHAFSDNAALKALGNDFTDTVTGVFTEEDGAGEVGTENKGVPIGAFFCSQSQAAVDAQVAKGSSAPPPSPPPPPPSPSSSCATVRIQNIFDNGETATQLEIPIDILFVTEHTLLTKKSNTLSIVSATDVDVNGITCQAFKDTNGRRAIGASFGAEQGAVLAPYGAGATFKAIKCVSQ